MSNKHGRNGPQFAMPGGKIQLHDAAMNQLIAERQMLIGSHLEEMNKGMAVEGSAINAVVLAAIQHGGLPPLAEQAAFFERAKGLAKLISDDQLVRRATNVKALLKDLNVHQATPALVWSCKQAGVELFDPAPAENDAKADEPKIVTEH